jgi:hypothetical protein
MRDLYPLQDEWSDKLCDGATYHETTAPIMFLVILCERLIATDAILR